MAESGTAGPGTAGQGALLAAPAPAEQVFATTARLPASTPAPQAPKAPDAPDDVVALAAAVPAAALAFAAGVAGAGSATAGWVRASRSAVGRAVRPVAADLRHRHRRGCRLDLGRTA